MVCALDGSVCACVCMCVCVWVGGWVGGWGGGGGGCTVCKSCYLDPIMTLLYLAKAAVPSRPFKYHQYHYFDPGRCPRYQSRHIFAVTLFLISISMKKFVFMYGQSTFNYFCHQGDVTWAYFRPLWPWADEPVSNHPDSKVNGANMGPIWSRQDPSGPYVGAMNLAIWERNQRHADFFVKLYTCNLFVTY